MKLIKNKILNQCNFNLIFLLNEKNNENIKLKKKILYHFKFLKDLYQ